MALYKDVENIERDKIKHLRRAKNRDKFFLVFKGRMPSRAVADRIAWLGIRDDRRAHYVVSKKEPEKRFAERFVLALENWGGDKRIVDGWWEGDVFVVVALSRKGFIKQRVPLEKLRALHGCSRKELEDFEIDKEGLFVYWPAVDVHLGWEAFEQACDPRAWLKARQQSAEFNRAYGAAIRRVRQKNKLRQQDIEGLTARQVGRIERGECRATYAALAKLAKAHGMSLDEYLDQLSKFI